MKLQHKEPFFLELLERIVFYALIVFLPTQLGRHFWPEYTSLLGLRVDYLSPTLYVTDVLVVLLLLFSILHNKYKLSSFVKRRFTMRRFLFVLFTAFLVVNISTSKMPQAGWYSLIKLAEFVFLGLYVARVGGNYQKSIPVLFCLGIIFESLLAFAQFYNQGSIGGILYYVGERAFNAQSPGIANASLYGDVILRSYATLPHPNVLAGYLLVGMTILCIFGTTSTPYKKLLFTAAMVLGTGALFLTMSRISIILWIIVVVFMIRKTLFSPRIFLLVFLFTGAISLFFPFTATRFFSLSLKEEAVTNRLALAGAAFDMGTKHPFTGVGLGNFLPNLPDFMNAKRNIFYLQPVHNIYLLAFAETGIFGLAALCLFLWRSLLNLFCLQTEKIVYILLFAEVCVIGFFDHYFLTLQQGQLLFVFVLGICWRKIYRQDC